ncbi:MAG: SLBB domain-containing protein, partial [Mobilitalea sp.]
MKKRWIVLGLSVTFLLISGICYSCAFQKKDTAVLSTLELKDGGTDTEAAQNANVENKNMLSPTVSKEENKEASQNKDKVFLYAHVCGAVVNPGVYKAEFGARVVDFINLAGGLTKEAAADYINQAKS